MTKRAIRVSETEAANDLPSLLARVRAGAEVVIERDAEAVAMICPVAPHVRLLSESLRLAKERSSNATLDGEFRPRPGSGGQSPSRTAHPPCVGLILDVERRDCGRAPRRHRPSVSSARY